MNCRNSSRMVSMHSWRACISSSAWRIAKNTVLTLRVCGVVFSSVYPCDISETAMKLAVDWRC